MIIASAQTIVSSDIAANGSAIREMIMDAASQEVRLVNFCEGALSGYAKAQIKASDDWAAFDWAAQEAELRAIADLCRQHRIFAVVGGVHRLGEPHPPHNSLYVFSDAGTVVTRYDKRLLSHSELSGWYTPGAEPLVFDVDGYRFGCAICIESQFPEVFIEYERRGVDAVLFSSYGFPPHFQVAIQAHAGLNCIWISAATLAQTGDSGPAATVGPDGNWIARCQDTRLPALALATLNRANPAYDIALNKARPWRANARKGEIYLEKLVNDPRSRSKTEY